MNPVSPAVGHPERTFGANQPQYVPVPVATFDYYGDGSRVLLTRWTLTPEEREAVARGEDIYVAQLNFGTPMTPLLVRTGAGDFATPEMAAAAADARLVDPGEPFTPNWYVPTSESIQEHMKHQGIDRAQLADRSWIPRVTLDAILDDDLALAPYMARGLAHALGGSERFWLNLDANYRRDRARIDGAKEGAANG